jgi:hypothetical protein
MSRRGQFVIVAAIVVLAVVSTGGALAVAIVHAQQPPLEGETTPVPSAVDDRVVTLERQLFDRDNEILRLQAEWANCRATVDSATLTTQAKELVARCESTYHVKCQWNDAQRRIVPQTATTTVDPKETAK